MTFVVTTETELTRVPPPALPLAQTQYTQGYQDQLNNVLRLYFNRLTGLLNQLQASGTISGLVAPHISAATLVSQYATGSNTPTKVAWDTLESAEGFTLNPSGSASAGYSGVYAIHYGLQLVNTDNAIHFATAWLRVNGVDVPYSAVKFTLPARKSAGEPFEMMATAQITFDLNAGDYVELWWATEQHATSGGAAGVYLQAEPAQTTPYPHPEVPSAIGSITFVSALP